MNGAQFAVTGLSGKCSEGRLLERDGHQASHTPTQGATDSEVSAKPKTYIQRRRLREWNFIPSLWPKLQY